MIHIFNHLFIALFIAASFSISTLHAQPKSANKASTPNVPVQTHKQPKARTKKHATTQQKARTKTEKKLLRDLSLQELQQERDALVKAGNKEIALKYTKKMLEKCKDMALLCDLTLEAADLYFECGHLTEAADLYSDFLLFYPGNQKVEYAQYKAILSTFYGTLDHERDQTLTRKTIELSRSFLERSSFTTYTKEVAKIKTSCLERLAESELNIVQFYLNRGNYLSAQTRIASIEKEFLKELPSLEPRLLQCKYSLAQKTDQQEQLKTIEDQLQKNFPSYSKKRVVAHNTKNALDRF